MLTCHTVIYDNLLVLRGRYQQSALPVDDELTASVSSFVQLSGALTSWLGLLQPRSHDLETGLPISTETIMHDFAMLKRAHRFARAAGNLSELDKLLYFYLQRLSAGFARIAASNQDVADFYDVTPWSGYLAIA